MAEIFFRVIFGLGTLYCAISCIIGALNPEFPIYHARSFVRYGTVSCIAGAIASGSLSLFILGGHSLPSWLVIASFTCSFAATIVFLSYGHPKDIEAHKRNTNEPKDRNA